MARGLGVVQDPGLQDRVIIPGSRIVDRRVPDADDDEAADGACRHQGDRLNKIVREVLDGVPEHASSSLHSENY